MMSDQRSNIPGLPVVYEDDSVIVVNKPSGMLSQPGKTVSDSVLTRVKQACPDAHGSILVHRLDMDTSGLMVLAKQRTAHRLLQQQFEHRRIGKRYVARLCQVPQAMGGRIHLPLRGDIEDRPRQVVCHRYGKSSTTVWRLFGHNEPECVWLFPLTGRTHQLRVHMADPAGLGMAIQGDRLYQGHYPDPIDTDARNLINPTAHPCLPDQGSGRLMLHAQYLAFEHPETGVRKSFQSPVDFLENGQQ